MGMGFSAWMLLPLCTLPMAYPILQTVLTHDESGNLQPMTPRASRLALLYSIFLAIGIAISPA
jgi:1,4-dihydroxy-2-naphthoate octaprenyltransferase